MNLLFLIGMPFSGKSYWGKVLSEKYDIACIDTDTVIEQETGKRVAAIFETEGEDRFRLLEKELLARIIEETRSPLIVACGGGTPIFNDNMVAMKKAGCVVYLKAGILTLTRRFELVEERNERPLLSDVTDIEEELDTLLKKRKYIYEQAHYTVQVETATTSNFEQIIESCTGRQ